MKRLNDAMVRHIAAKRAPGIVTGVLRRGQLDVGVHGHLALDGVKPMQRDTIFRLASITKLVTAVATFSLCEEAKLHLDDPVDEWLPELAKRRVLSRIDAPLEDTVPAKRAITVRDLLTFKLGFGLVFGQSGSPIQKAIADRALHLGPPRPQAAPPPDEWIRRLGELPLMFQPGEQWLYSAGSDVLGVLLARVTGKPLEAVIEERVCGPLGMKDTAFYCPVEKIDRLATGYMAIKPSDPLTFADSPTDGEWSKPPSFPYGSAGLVSTLDDLMTFGKMLLHEGAHGKERILSRGSVRAMATNQLTGAENADAYFFKGFTDSHGWGLGCSVITKRTGHDASPGAFGWDGGWGTSLWIDPAEDMVGVLLTQRSSPPNLSPIYKDFWALVYAGLDG